MSWQRILGHDAHRQGFAHAQQRGRLAHAYLFVGPTGVGKRAFARELAKALLCEKPPSAVTACDQCPSCILMTAGNHPDFVEVARPEDKNVVPIELMRELCRRFTLKAALGRGKIALLDDADDLDEEAANCFLKTLEEPPPRSIFFLIGTSPELQLATIVSRCQVVRFVPLPEEAVEQILRQHGITDPVLLKRAARMGRGSPGQALAFTDPELWTAHKNLLQGLLLPRPDTVALAKGLMEFVEEAGKELAAQRRRANQVLKLLIEFLNDTLAVAVGRFGFGDAAETELMRNLANRADPEKLLQVLERCLEADAQIGWYIQLVLVLEGLLDALGVALGAGATGR